MDRAEALHKYLDIDRKKIEYEEEDLRTQAPDFWEDPERARAQMKVVGELKKWLDGYREVRTAADEVQLAMEFYKDEMVTEEEVDEAYARAMKAIENLELKNMLRQEEDPMDAVLKINSGAGGTEAQDWTQMLYRMYTRYCEQMGFEVKLLDLLDGDEAGIKSVTFEVSGDHAYGYLRGEKGVHRLVRISPFDSNARRHTSFSSLDVAPMIEDDGDEIKVDMKYVRVDTYHSSGAGGQNVNKTSSAVRMTYVKDDVTIVVACQTERDQVQNRATCMKMLKAKLLELKEREKEQQMADIKGEMKKIEWGSQIRSYVFQPYTMVKDHRTNYESGNIDDVMNGNLEGFVTAYLKMQ